MARRKVGRRTHWSHKPIKTLHRKYIPPDTFFKPIGLWYEVEGEMDWQEFTKDAGFTPVAEMFKYEVRLGDLNMLVIRNIGDMVQFTAKYSVVDDRFKSLLFKMAKINWHEVYKDYDGIEIPEYLWSCRMDDRFWWYYGWDVACGVIWRPKNSTIKLLREPLRKADSGKSKRKRHVQAL